MSVGGRGLGGDGRHLKLRVVAHGVFGQRAVESICGPIDGSLTKKLSLAGNT